MAYTVVYKVIGRSGDGGNSEGLTVNYVDKPGNCMAVSKGAYYFQGARS